MTTQDTIIVKLRFKKNSLVEKPGQVMMFVIDDNELYLDEKLLGKSL